MEKNNSNKIILIVIALLLAGILIVLLSSNKGGDSNYTKEESSIDQNLESDQVVDDLSAEIEDVIDDALSYVNYSLGVSIDVDPQFATFKSSDSFANQSAPSLKSIITIKNPDGSNQMVIGVPKNNDYFEQQLSNRTYVGIVTYNGVAFKKYSQPAPDNGGNVYSYVYQKDGKYYEIYTQDETNLNLLNFI